MGASNDPALKFSKNSQVNPPGAIARQWRKTAAETKLEKAYREVDERDGMVCVVSGVKLSPKSQDSKRRLEHHHIKGRRVRPEWRERPERIVSVSSFVHELLTNRSLDMIGDDARKPLFFQWNRRLVPPGKEPFRLRLSVRPPQAVAS